ncbi:MAG: glycosyltransferase family 39 protein [Planctomycetes bacterium]|nr:glycosyltransferase family 39 protein [Planctomycetota bacterium]
MSVTNAPNESPMRATLPGPWAYAALALAIGVVLLPSALVADFVNFDDPRFFGPDSELERAGLAGLLDPRQRIADAYLPVSHFLYWLENRLGGSPLLAHLVALVLHFAFAVGLVRLLARFGLDPRAATLAGLLVAVHPALVESVLWASSQKDLLAGGFVVASLAVLARHAHGELGTARAALLAGASALFALYAKGTALVLGPLALLLALSFGRRRGAARFGPAVLVAVIAALATLHHASIATEIGTMNSDREFAARAMQVPGAALHYLRTALWPTSLDVLYPELATLAAFRANLVPGLVAMAGLASAALVARRRAPRVAAGLLAFAIALAPFNTALPATSIAAADRYLHLALPGLALALVAVPRCGVVLGVIALVPLAWLAHARAADFESSERLWTASTQRDAENAVALFNLASARSQQGASSPAALAEIESLLERAVEVARYPQHRWRAATSLAELAQLDARHARAQQFAELAATAADELDPRQPGALDARLRAHLAAARAARRNEDPAAAKRHYDAAHALAPEHPFVLAFAAAQLHGEAMDPQGNVDPADPRVAQADALLDAAERADPALYELHWTRGIWRRATGRLLEAEASLRRAVLVDPRRSEAWLARCDLFLAQEGLAATAERLAREGAAAVGEAAAAPLLFRRALALGTLGRLDDARTLYEACHRLRPHDAQIRAGLAAVLASIGVRDLFTASPDALDRLGERIAELDPTNPQGQLIRAVALRGRKQIADALILLEQVRPLLAGDAEVEQLWAETLRDRAWQLWFDESTRAASWPLFRRFVDEAPARVDSEAVRNLLEQEWQRRLSAGQTALIEKDPARAERALRDCLQLRPEDSAPNLQLGMALLLRDTALATSEEALRCFELAGEGQRRTGRDMGLAILYQATALKRLGRLDEARRRADAYLASPGVTADATIATRIRELLDG